MDELLIESVICFLKVELDGYKTRFDFPGLKTVEKLISDYLIFCNPFAWYKSRLTGRDYLMKKRS